ncbi:MAG: transglutaminase-like domain-containing protein [Myxococcota bacterium]
MWLAATEQQHDIDAFAANIAAALDNLAAPIRIPEGSTTIEAVARLQLQLFHTLQLKGDSEAYDSPENSFIDQVIERRKGLPILLSTVCVAVGARVGLDLDPIGFPGHFLVGVRHADPRFFLDPFHSGQVLPMAHLRGELTRQNGFVDDSTFEAVLTPPPTRDVLIRMCTNLALSYVRRHERSGATRMLSNLQTLGAGEGQVAKLLERFLADH